MIAKTDSETKPKLRQWSHQEYERLAEIGIISNNDQVQLVNGLIMMSDTYDTLRQWTRSEYHQMAESGVLRPGEKLELIKGKIIEMSPISSKHAAMLKKLVALLSSILSSEYQLSVQDPILISGKAEPEPDLVICKYREDFYVDQHPTTDDIYLIIEVSKSTLEYDLIEKMPLYAEAGILEYWVVDLEHSKVIQFYDPVNGKYQEKRELDKSDILHSAQLNIDIDLKKVYG